MFRGSVMHHFHRHHFRKPGVFQKCNARFAGPFADDDLAAAKRLADHSCQESEPERFSSRNGDRRRLQDYRSATVARNLHA